MKPNTIITLVSFLFLYSSSCLADFSYDALDLRRYCHEAVLLDDNPNRNDVNAWDIGTCYGYITAVIDEMSDYAQMFAKSDKYNDAKKYFLFCLDNGVTKVEIARILVKYLDDHPDELHYSASSTLMTVLTKDFPCDSQQQK